MTTDESKIQPGQAKQAAKTTIVGGQPPGNDRLLAEVPVGLEQLLAMAASSEKFSQVLREEPDRAIEASGLQLTDTERAVLRATPEPMLDKMIGRVQTLLPKPERRLFLERAGSALVVLLGAGVLAACKDSDKGARGGSGGGDPKDMPRPMETMRPPPVEHAPPGPPAGSRPDKPPPMDPPKDAMDAKDKKDAMKSDGRPQSMAGATKDRPPAPSAGARVDRPMVPKKRRRPKSAPKSRGISPRDKIDDI